MEILKDPEFWVAVGFVIVIGIFLYQRVPAFIDRGAGQSRGRASPRNWTKPSACARKPRPCSPSTKRRPARSNRKPRAILTEAKAEAERFAAESRTQLKAQIERRAQVAQDKIAQAEAQAMAEIRALAADAAAAAAEKLIAARLDDKRAERPDRAEPQRSARQAELRPLRAPIASLLNGE